MHVLLAPDKFKGSLSAAAVAKHLAAGLHAARPALQVVELPVADGGEGTLRAAIAAGFTRIPVQASGPTGAVRDTSYARRHDTALVELATVCGLLNLPGRRPEPRTASSYGLGQVLRHAVRAGCRRVLIGIGGSASTDGGAGLLAALGARITDAGGALIPPGGAPLVNAAELDLTGLDPALAGVEVVVANDVDNPLLGPRGAARVYAPQKGATPYDVAVLEDALAHWAHVVADAVGHDWSATPGAGAAGGVGFAALAVLGAQLRPGIELVLELAGFADKLGGCQLVITGEGALDEQTLAGKVPAGVAAAAHARGVPVVAVAGQCTLSGPQLAAAGIAAVYALTDLEPDLSVCISQAGPLLERAAASMTQDWLGIKPHCGRSDRHD